MFIWFCFFWPSKEIREGGRQLLDKLQKYKPLIAAFNGKGTLIGAAKRLNFEAFRRLIHKAIGRGEQRVDILLISSGIYEIFCKETFGVKAKNLDFGLQPYKIPETETVR